MESITRLDELVQKSSKLSNAHARDAASLLIKLFEENCDKAKIAYYIMLFKSTVCQFFFEQAVDRFKMEEIESLYMTICSTEAYKKNIKNAGITRGFLIAAVLIKTEQEIARTVLMRTLADAERGGKFSPAIIKNFQKHVMKYCGDRRLIDALGDANWNNMKEKSRFDRFMQSLNDAIKIELTPRQNENGSKAIAEAPDTGATTEPEETVTESSELRSTCSPSHTETALPLEVKKAHLLTSELLVMLEHSTQELQALLGTLHKENETFFSLRQKIEEREARISELGTSIQERDRHIDELMQEIHKREQGLSEKQAEVVDLTERLKIALRMEDISQSQELVTLKTDLSNSLRIEYADYLANREKVCTVDMFEAHRGSLTRVFKTLRRFGITVD